MLRTRKRNRGVYRVPTDQAAIESLLIPCCATVVGSKRDGRNPTRSSFRGAVIPEKLSRHTRTDSPTTSSRRQSARFPKILPKVRAASSPSPLQRSLVSFPQSSSEDSASTTSLSRSSTPASNADLTGLEHIIGPGLSLNAAPILSSLAAHGSENLHVVTTAERSGRGRSSHPTTHISRNAYGHSSQPPLNASRKRKHNTSNGSGGDDGHDERDGRHGRSKRKASGNSEGFPCPYSMRYQEASLKNSCRKSRFETIPRLKEHLRRVHYNPSLCSRCYAEFSDFSQHERQNPPCTINFDACSLQFGPSQYARLHDKMRGKSNMDKWREIWIILFPEDGQENIPLPNSEDLSMYQRHDLIDRLQESVFASFKDWEHYLVQQAEAGFIPAADGDLDISWLVTPLRSKLTEVFSSFRESHFCMNISPAKAEERAGMAAYPIEGQPAYPHEPGSSRPQASFAGGEPLSQRPEQSQTVNLANVHIQNAHDQYVPVGMQYHPQPLHGDLWGAFHPWYPHEASPYHDQLDRSRYDNNE